MYAISKHIITDNLEVNHTHKNNLCDFGSDSESIFESSSMYGAFLPSPTCTVDRDMIGYSCLKKYIK